MYIQSTAVNGCNCDDGDDDDDDDVDALQYTSYTLIAVRICHVQPPRL